jgi:hypothetical protein
VLEGERARTSPSRTAAAKQVLLILKTQIFAG